MIACSSCRTIVAAENINTGKLFACAVCGVRLRADIFPAFNRAMASGRAGEHVQEQGQAECFNHPGKQAVAPCAGCGRLLCGLCEIRLEDRSLCVSCLQSGRKKQTLTSLENQRTLYDNMALSLAVWPLLLFYLTLLTAPVALYMCIRYWNAPTSILPRSRVRFVLAGLLAVGQLIGWGFLFFTLFG